LKTWSFKWLCCVWITQVLHTCVRISLDWVFFCQRI
jgi:hypothetical protein